MAALRSFALSLSSGRPFCAADLVVQAEDRGADDLDGLRRRHHVGVRCTAPACDVLAFGFFGLAAEAEAFGLALRALALSVAGRLSPSAIVAVTGLLLLAVGGLSGGSGEQQAGRDGGDGQNSVQDVRGHGGDLRVDRCVGSSGGSSSTRRAVPWHESFGSPASSESPVALRPVLADGLPFREAGTSCCPHHRHVWRNLHASGQPSESRCDTGSRRGVAQLGSARALGARGPGFKSRRPDTRRCRASATA